MSSHEVIYFDGPGRAEAIRVCLHIAGADWKDTRFKGTDWPTIKPTTPLGSVPVLKVDGVSHVQSLAILRYAGKLAGLYPEDALEALVVDEVLDSLNEVMSKAPKSSDKDELKKMREEFQATTLTKYSEFMEAAIQRNGGTGFSTGLNIADLALKATVDMIASGMWDYIDPKFYESYPGIMATANMVKENDKIKSYYDK